MQKSRKRIVSAIVSASLVLGLWTGYAIPARAEENGSGQTPPTEIGEPTPTPTVTPSASPSVEPSTEPSAEPTVTPEPVDVTKIAISRKSAVLMVGKTLKPVITGTTSTVTWTSANEKIAKVDETGKIKALKKGKTVITAAVDGITKTCEITVVAKMAKKDFSKFNSENFVNFCQRYGYNHGYAWNGQWKGGSKKKATARGIKMGASKTKVQKAYGELTWKKCTSKDPFSKMKGLKKNKVKTYGDAVYGKYRIRFYLNSKKKVVAIIFACNISKIKKKHLKKYM